MTVLYADPSALLRAYSLDADDHAELRAQLLEGRDPVVACEVARLELARAVTSAARAGHLERPDDLLDQLDADCGPDGPLILIVLRPATVVPAALRLLAAHPLSTLAALHLAVALEEAVPLAAPDLLLLVTRDDAQGAAARAEGLGVV